MDYGLQKFENVYERALVETVNASVNTIQN